MQMKTWLPMLGLALTSATASAQKVTYDYDKATDFTKIRTYAWVHCGIARFANGREIVATFDPPVAPRQ